MKNIFHNEASEINSIKLEKLTIKEFKENKSIIFPMFQGMRMDMYRICGIESSKDYTEKDWTNDIEKIKNGERIYFFIKLNNEVAGFILCSVRSLEKGACWISDIYVKEDFRDSGIGREALALVMIELKKLRFTKVNLRVCLANSRAIHVYEKLGFKAYSQTMERKL